MSTHPSISKQKSFIIDNSKNVLNHKTKLDILRLVMVKDSNVIMEMSGTKEISIKLDLCKKETIWHIYSIVKNRLELLNQPLSA